jgi:hypothetical protein
MRLSLKWEQVRSPLNCMAFYLPGSKLCDRFAELSEWQEGNIEIREFDNPTGFCLVAPSAR